MIATGIIIWRDRAFGPVWQTVTAALLFALMVVLSGHDDLLIGVGVGVLAIILAQAIASHVRPRHAGPVPPQPTAT